MGWYDSHLHEFAVGERRIGEPNPEDRLMGVPLAENERRVRLSGMLDRVGAKARYTYDFGDSWEHNIVLEKILPPDPFAEYPMCSGGKFACPPEDCGGIPGYYHFLEVFSDSDHEEHEEMREWIGGDYDPQDFSVEYVNHVLTPFRRRSKNPRQ
jgi:hypothetical protein